MQAIKRILARWIHWKKRAFLRWLSVRLSQKLIHWEYLIFYKKKITGNESMIACPVEVEFRIASLSEIERLFAGSPEITKKVREELERGCECVVGEIDGKIIFSGWLDFQRIYETGVMNYPLNANQAYIYRIFTTPAYRGRGIATSAYGFMFNRLFQKNVSQCFLSVSFENAASIKTIEKNAFERCGAIHFIRFGKRVRIIRERLNRKSEN